MATIYADNLNGFYPANSSTSGLHAVRKLLAELPLLKGAEEAVLDNLAPEFEWFSVPGAQTLFQEGDKDDSLYIVLSGRLGAFIRNEEGKDVLIRQMLSGETVGELALLSGEPRSATVAALRDTEVLRLRKRAFDRLIEEHPRSLRFITDLLVRRLRQPRIDAVSEAPHTIAVIPLTLQTLCASFVRSLESAFESLGDETCILNYSAASRPVEWFNALEDSYGMVIYQGDFQLSPWTRLCFRQADRLVLLIRASEPFAPYLSPVESMLQDPRHPPCELVLLHDGEIGAVSADVADLLKRFDTVFVHNVRTKVPRDFRRLARLLTGRATGAVLSGGGARGFAHVGVLRALREAHVEIDHFGGASMGAIVAAGAALEWDNKELSDRMRAAFSDANPISDYTIPLIALVRGRKASRFLREHFGDRRIEDCLCPYFCVSSNLSTSRLHVHRSGPIWRSVRASTSIPGVLPPVVEGSDILVDGGFLNNLPLEVMSDMRRGQIIAVNVSPGHGLRSTVDELEHRPLWQLAGHARRGTPNIFTLLMAAGTLGGMKKAKPLRESVDLLIEPALESVGLLDWKSFEHAVDVGYRSTVAILEKIDPLTLS